MVLSIRALQALNSNIVESRYNKGASAYQIEEWPNMAGFPQGNNARGVLVLTFNSADSAEKYFNTAQDIPEISSTFKMYLNGKKNEVVIARSDGIPLEKEMIEKMFGIDLTSKKVHAL